MKKLVIILFLGLPSLALAQQPPAPPTSKDIENQIAEVGCRAERQAAASTIANLQKQVSELQAQLAKKPAEKKSR